MELIGKFLEVLNRAPSDITGIHIDGADTHVVRLTKNNDTLSLVGAEILSVVDLPPVSADSIDAVPPLSISTPLKARYAAIAISDKDSIVKLLRFPSNTDIEDSSRIVKSMGLSDPENYRVAYEIISEGHGKTEARILAVAIPEMQARLAALLIPTGKPAPYSVEVANLATLTAFLKGTGKQHADEAVGVIDFGFDSSTFVIFNRNTMSLIRKFEFGTRLILRKLQNHLGVDQDTARDIFADNAFDLSQLTSETLTPLINQLVVSRDFVERHENCHVSKVYLSGTLGRAEGFMQAIRDAMDVDAELWNPFDGLGINADAIPASIASRKWTLASALGACLGAFGV